MRRKQKIFSRNNYLFKRFQISYRGRTRHVPEQISQHFIEEVKGHHAFKWFSGPDDSISQFLPSCLTL